MYLKENFSFFHKIEEQLLRECLQEGSMQVITLDKKRLLDVSQDEDSPVYLLLNGKIVLQEHSLDDPYNLRTIQITKPGLFIGVQELDMGQSSHPVVFPIVMSHVAQLVKFSRAAYNRLAREVIDRDTQI